MKAVPKHLAFLFAFIILPLQALAATTTENLEYQLTWGGIKVGTSSIRTTVSGEELEVVSRLQSSSWSESFYQVDDTETSMLKKAGTGYALHQYRMKLKEGTNDWNRVVTLDRKGNKKIRFNNLITGEKSTAKLDETWDPVSSLYHLRQLPLTVGQPVHVNVVDKRKVNRIQVNVLRRETVTTRAGTFRTIVISPAMNLESEGLFYAPGPLTIWLTDDAKKVPVVIEKRIEDLFKSGAPEMVQKMVPPGIRNNPAKLETVRAELVGGKW